ncbi:MAG TPA: hypothetical protein VJ878_01420 [Candidatus Izemoplasmatales bacterium]|nr:hypothetical protein [Candidatus Izemoplasmatales bacterium]
MDRSDGISNKRIKEITIKEKYDGKYIEVIHVYEEDEQIRIRQIRQKRWVLILVIIT